VVIDWHSNQLLPIEGEKMKSNKMFLLALGLLLLSLLLVACGSAAPTSSNFPTGKFIKSGTTNYALVFNNDGTFSVMEGSSTIVTGTYSVDGEIFTDESNSQGCPPMSFKYTLDGANLTFNYVGKPADDPCGGRYGDFNNVTYVLTK
jgi:hypothetical protein